MMDKKDIILVLLHEIEYFKTQIQPHDTGHIHTTINTLQNRVDQLIQELYNSDNN